MKKTFLLPIVLVAALLAGCGGSGSASLQKDDVAVVGKVRVTKAQYDALIAQAKSSFKQQGRAFPKHGTTDYETVKGQAITLLIQQAERQSKANSMGVKISDAQVQKRLDQIIKQYFQGKQSKYEAQLKKQHLTDAQVRKDIHSQLTSEGVFNKVTKDVTVSNDDAHQYYITHPQLYTQPQSRDVRYILVKSKALADSIYRQVKAGNDKTWCTLAKKYAKDASGQNCGKATFTKGHGAGLRQGRVLAADEDGARADLRPRSVQVVVRRRTARHREAAQVDAGEAGLELDQAAADPAEEEPEDDRLGHADLEGLLLGLEDQVPDRLQADSGSLRDRDCDHERHDDRLARWVWRTRSSSSKS